LNTFVPALALHLRDSPVLRRIRHALYVVTLAGMLCLPVAVVVRAGCALLLLGALIGSGRRQAPPFARLELHADGQCVSLDQQGRQADWRLGPDSLCMPGLIILALDRPSGAPRYLWLPADAVDAAEQRRLRIRVRLAA
jgi:Membrane-bound toxin component of toxin-antitoxin system